jgi:hypothetical protein
MALDELEETFRDLQSGDIAPGVGDNSSFFRRQIDRIHDHRKETVNNSLNNAVDKDPDKQAKVIDLSREFLTSPEIVDQDFDFYNQQASTKEFPIDEILSKAPRTTNFLADPVNAPLVKDDLNGLTQLETAVNNVLRNSSSQAQSTLDSIFDISNTETADASDIFKGFGLKLTSGFNHILTSYISTAAALDLIPHGPAALVNSHLYENQKILEGHMPGFVRNFNKLVEAESPNIDQNFNRFVKGIGDYYSFVIGEDTNVSVKNIFQDLWQGGKGTVGESLEFVSDLKNHKLGTSAFVIENLPNTAISIIPAMKGAKVLGSLFGASKGGAFLGRKLGVVSGQILGGGPLEFGSQVSQELLRKGIDVTDPNELFKIYSDPLERSKLRRKGIGKAFGTIGTDALLSLFLLGRFSRMAQSKGFLARSAAKFGDIGVDMFSEAVSEGVGQAVAGDDVSFTEMLLEGLAAGPQSFAEVTIASGSDIIKRIQNPLNIFDETFTRQDLQKSFDDALFSTSQQDIPEGIPVARLIRSHYSSDPYEAMESLAGDAKNAATSLNETNTLYAIGKTIKEMKLTKRSKSKLLEAIRELVPKEASVLFSIEDWNGYWRKNNESPDAIAEQIYGDDIIEYHNDKQSGSALSVPLDRFLAVIGPEEHYENLVPKARMRFDSFLPNKMKEFFDGLPVTVKEMADELSKTDADPIRKASVEIRDTMEKQVRKTKRFQGEQATAAGSLMESLFQSFAARSDVPLPELKKKFNFLIENLPKEDPKIEIEEGEGLPLLQTIKSSILGKYTPDFRKISLYKKASFATLLHELGHGFFQNFEEIALAEPEGSDLRKDWFRLRDFVGAKEGQNLTRNHAEKLSIAFNKYLSTGIAPVPKLQAAFELFKNWITEAYTAFKGLQVQLPDDVTEIFDRMVVSDVAVDEAIERSGIVDIPAEAFDSREEASAVNDILREHKAQSYANERKKHFDKIKRLGKKSKKYRSAREKASTKINDDPRYIALSIMGNGKLPDGTVRNPDIPRLKINKNDLVQEFGEDILTGIPDNILVDKGGVHPQVVANTYGVDILSLESLPTLKDAIENETARILLEEEGEFAGLSSLDETLDSIMNDKKEQVLSKTFKLLASSNFNDAKKLVKGVLNRKIPTNQELKTRAEDIVKRSKIYRFTPNKYLLNQRRFSKQAVNAVLNGNIEVALASMENYFLNFYAYKEAIKHQPIIRKTLPRYLKSFNKKNTIERVAKSKFGHIDVIHSILERFGYRGPPSADVLADRVSLAEYVEAHKEEHGNKPTIPPSIMNEAFSSDYQDLTIGQALDLKAAVKSLEFQSIKIRKFYAQKEWESIDEFRKIAVKSIDDNNPKGRTPLARSKAVREKGFKRHVVGALAPQIKSSTIARMLDGNKDNGPMTRAITFRYNEIADNETIRLGKEFKSMLNLLKKNFTRKQRIDLNNKYKAEFIPVLGEKFTKMDELIILGNLGNPEGLNRFENEFRDKGIDVNEVIDVLIGRLEKHEFDYLNDLWSYLDSFWPEVKKKAIDNDGFPPPRVESIKRETKWGTLTGGFYPLDYDSQIQESRKETVEDIHKKFAGGQAFKAYIRTNHRQKRLSNLKAPIKLDFSVVTKHVKDVVHDLTHFETVRDIHRILTDRSIEKAIKENYGSEYYFELKKTLDDIITGDVPAQNTADKWFNWFRSGQAIATMAWSATTALVQPLGLAQGMVRVGPKWVLKGMGRWLGDTARMESTYQWVIGKSKFMRDVRSETITREVRDLNNSFSIVGTLTIPGTDIDVNDIRDSFFYVMVKTQLIADMPTWIGQYEKSMEQIKEQNPNMDVFELERQAIQNADQAVIDSQATGQIKDLARVQRGTAAQKIWTVYLTYFNATLQVMFDRIGRADMKNVKSVGLLAADLLLLTALPATLETVAKSLLRGDDEEELIDDILKNNASYLLGTVVGLRELNSFVYGFRGYSGPAGIRFISDLGNMFQQIGQGELDEALLRSIARTSGTLFHLPTTQLDRLARGAISIKEGETKNPMVLLMGPPWKRKKKGKKRSLGR